MRRFAERNQRIALRGGFEQDAFTGWRHVLCYMQRPRVRAAAKRQYHHRWRRQVRGWLQEIKKEIGR